MLVHECIYLHNVVYCYTDSSVKYQILSHPYLALSLSNKLAFTIAQHYWIAMLLVERVMLGVKL